MAKPKKKVLTKELAEAYIAGARAGIEMYAHRHDGIDYVGTIGKTLQQALDELSTEEILVMKAIEEMK